MMRQHRSQLVGSPDRHGVTLVELLIAAAIIGILAAITLGAAAAANSAARTSKTRTMISKLHALLMERWESYEARRTELTFDVERQLERMSFPTAQNRHHFMTAVRLNAMRELMLSEMPDRWSDVYLNNGAQGGNVATPNLLYTERSALSRTYYNAYRQIVGRRNSLTGTTNTIEDIRRFQGAECLYLIIMNATGDGEARAQFHESDIGDVDGDGAREFLDGWGRPINFVRWAPGFDSTLQGSITRDMSLQLNDEQLNNAMVAFANQDHDPFDVYRSQLQAFRLVPLIYSAGPDQQYGVLIIEDSETWPQAPNQRLSRGLIESFAPNPYRAYGRELLGMAAAQNLTAQDDNIHNHLIEGR